MKDVAMNVLARIVCELPYLLIFWIPECIFIAWMSLGFHVPWLIYPAMLLVNICIVALCDLLDQFLDRIIYGKE